MLVVMMAVGAGLEALGIGMVVPLVGVLSSEDASAAHPWIQEIYRMSGLASWSAFVMATAGALFLAFFIKNAYLALFAYMQARFIFRRYARLSTRLLESYLTAPYVMHLQRNSADLIRNLTNEVNGFVTGVLVPGLTFIAECLVVLAIAGLLIAIDPAIALAAVAFFGGAVLVVQRLLKPLLRRVGHDRIAQSSSAIRWVQQSLGAVKEIKLAGREPFFLDAFRTAIERYAIASRTFATVNSAPRLIVEMLGVAGVVLMLAFAPGTKELVPVLALYALAGIRLMPSFTRMFAATNSLRFYYPSVAALAGDLQGIASHTSTAMPVKLRVRSLPQAPAIEVRDLSYRYPEEERMALSGVSFTAPAGSVIGIEGPSGAGKSTLVDVLIGLLTPLSGQVRINDVPLDQLRDDWQRVIGYVPQVVYLLDDSVRRNVAFGFDDESVDDARVWRALEAARLAKCISALPGGLDGAVGERGTKLSVGERQRLGIARALYTDPCLIVLDEPTSALDSVTEREFTETVSGLAGKRTLIIISHRAALLDLCDIRVSLKGGKLERVHDRNPTT